MPSLATKVQPEETVTLEIRHQIGFRGEAMVVIERFGNQQPMEWIVPDRATADKLVAERRAILKQMVADISPEAAEAVRDARNIDNIRGGNA